MLQRRWFCKTCQREWVYAHAWEPDDGCPGCHSASIEQVEYQSAAPGLDIPRDGTHIMIVTTVKGDPSSTPLPLIGGAL